MMSNNAISILCTVVSVLPEVVLGAISFRDDETKENANLKHVFYLIGKPIFLVIFCTSEVCL
jgi:hypothetical protein